MLKVVGQPVRAALVSVLLLGMSSVGPPGADALFAFSANPSLSAARPGGLALVPARPVGGGTGRPHHLVVGRTCSGVRGLLRMNQGASNDPSKEEVDELPERGRTARILQEQAASLDKEAGGPPLLPVIHHRSPDGNP